MLPLEHLAAVRIALEVCNDYTLKENIYCVPIPQHDREVNRYEYSRKGKWNTRVENTAEIILKQLGLIKQLRKKVTSLLILIGIRMLNWTKYHEGTLGLTPQFSIKFLNSSFFTSYGTIDNKKAAEELMKANSLCVTQKYSVACLYCLTGHIPDLYRQMSKKDMEEFYDGKNKSWSVKPEIVKFWSYFLMGKIDELRGEKTVDEYMLKSAVASGSKTAVEYCIEETSLRKKKDVLIDVALDTVKNSLIKQPNTSHTILKYVENDWVIFRNPRSRYWKWIPSDYFVDILCFLLLKMTEDQRIEFLKKDIEGVDYEITAHGNSRHSRVLEYLLDWPYQNYFMKTAQLMWEFLPERSYAELLLKICDKMNPRTITLKYGEDKTYEYMKLLGEFWCQSPDRYKRYVFSDKKINHRSGYEYTLKEGKKLLLKMFTLKNFTYEDWKRIELILDSATVEEKESITSSEEGRDICFGLIEEEKWEILDEFISNCFPSEEGRGVFKRDLIFREESQRLCINFIAKDKWDSVELFIKWSSLSEGQISLFKRVVIYSVSGREAYLDLLSSDKEVSSLEKFLSWCFPSEEKKKTYKKYLLFTYGGIRKCADLVEEDRLDFVEEFVSWSLSSSEEEKRKFKEELVFRIGHSVCAHLITNFKSEGNLNVESMSDYSISCKKGKWERVEMFLTWCFSSKEEIRDFKRKRLLKFCGGDIHLNLIMLNRWDEAETFFEWLELSPEEVKGLKKETLFNHKGANEMFSNLMYSREDHERFPCFGSKQERVELLLRWCLTDIETALEFRDHFKQRVHDRGNITEEDRAVLEEFDSAIEQRLSYLEDEQRGGEKGISSD